MQTLIIGANGYIGSRLFNELSSCHAVTGIDTNWYGDHHLVTVGDMSQLSSSYLNTFDTIILLAGHSSVKMCDGLVGSSWNNNVRNFVNLVKKLKKSQLLIYASSGSVYGSDQQNTTEDTLEAFSPMNHYDLSKYVLDLHAESFIKEGYNIVGLRFGTVNGYSPNMRSELMINSMTINAITNNKITINNTHVHRPILGITDLCNGVKTIMMKPVPGIFNMASFCSTVLSIGNEVAEFFNIEPTIIPDTGLAYNFSMNVGKFIRCYDFNFSSTIRSITEEITSNINTSNFGNRNNYKTYE